MELRKSLYQQLIVYVTSYALGQIQQQHELLIVTSTALSRCTKVFITIIGLLCSHTIQERLFGEEGCLILEDLHSH
jgi:hypothetical protein